MAGSELAKKLKLKPGARAAVIGAPEGYLAELEPLPEGVNLGPDRPVPGPGLGGAGRHGVEVGHPGVDQLHLVGLLPAAVPPRGTAAEEPLAGIV